MGLWHLHFIESQSEHRWSASLYIGRMCMVNGVWWMWIWCMLKGNRNPCKIWPRKYKLDWSCYEWKFATLHRHISWKGYSCPDCCQEHWIGVPWWNKMSTLQTSLRENTCDQRKTMKRLGSTVFSLVYELSRCCAIAFCCVTTHSGALNKRGCLHRELGCGLRHWNGQWLERK